MNIESSIGKVLKRIHKRAEYEMSDTNYYRQINEHIINKDSKIFGRSIAFTITSDTANRNQHLLELSILHPTMMVEIKRPLATGSKKEILDYLAKDDTPKALLNDIVQMSERLSTQ